MSIISPLIPPFDRARAVVFDFDGTLAELTLDFGTMNLAVETAVRAVLPSAPEFTAPALEWVSRCAELASPLTGQAERLRAEAEKAMIAVETEAAARGRLFPQTRPVLRRLLEQGIKCGVLTRNCRAAVLAVFPDLENLCPLLTREDTATPKPAPGHLLQMLDLLEARPDKTLLVGDHPLDILTGKRAGTMTCGVTCGHCDAAGLLSAGADLVLENCGQLLASPENAP